MLVSLLGDPLPNSVRVASATAIAIMCCSDGPCQDALRHADGLKYLVYLANSEDLRVAQASPPRPPPGFTTTHISSPTFSTLNILGFRVFTPKPKFES